MRHAAPSPQPPRLVAWLVSLFGSSEQAESILGDLAEEFSDIASKSEVASARRWYWRQSLKTIAYLAGSSFRTAPWSVAAVVLLGPLLMRFSFALSENAIVAILRMQKPYSNLHYGFYVWLVTYGSSILRVIQTILIGCSVAAFAKGREIVATLTLGLVSRALTVVLFLLLTGGHWPKSLFPWPILIVHVENLVAFVIGGVIIREFRSVVTRQFHAHDLGRRNK